LLFVSSYEGFGMPPLEALSIGCPVVLSDIPAHRCVYDDAARWSLLPAELQHKPAFVGVGDPAALASQMQRLIDQPAERGHQAQAGLAYSQTFSPQQTAAALVEAFHSVDDGTH
jgi:glycosyltransferase involved in cell wall biosynthesis